MDNIKNSWKAAKNEIETPFTTAADLISEAKKKRKHIVYFQYANIVILTLTLIGISLFFYYVAPFKTSLSHAGMALMIGALIIRILFEIYSLLKARKIIPQRNVASTTHDALSYYNYRKRVHGPVTVVTVALYIVGYAMLSPEFSIHIPFRWMVMMHVSFVVGAVFLTWQIRKGILKELENLNRLVKLNEELSST